MANKYLIHGATYCGTGTSSAEATSNGGTGAWNNINVLEGTAPAYGTLAAGDTVYIRSKTSAGADITRTAGANITLGSANASSANWIRWVLDNGTVWSGVAGTLTYELPSTYETLLVAFNQYVSLTPKNFVIKETNTNIEGKYLLRFPTTNPAAIDGLFIDMSANTHNGGNLIGIPAYTNVFINNSHLKWNKYGYNGLRNIIENCVRMQNTTLEVLSTNSGVGLIPIGANGRIELIGCQIIGTGITSDFSLFDVASSAGLINMVGTPFPRVAKLIRVLANDGQSKLQAVGMDGGSGAVLIEPWGYADSRSDGNYPTLDAYLPTSATTPWSWKIYPKQAAPHKPFGLTTLKLFTDTAAVKTITAHVMISNTNTTANKRSLWVDVGYTDNATGLPVTVSTRDYGSAALAADTAAWSASTYGAVTLTKKKIEITTPTEIKKDTPVAITLHGDFVSASDTDIVFFCPDIGIS